MADDLITRKKDIIKGEIAVGEHYTGSHIEGAPAIIRAPSLGSQSFNPASMLIPVGVVQLNQTDPYLSDLPDNARAEYLIAPQSTAEILRDGPFDLGTWMQDIVGTRNVNENHEFHTQGELVTGMQVFDRYEEGHNERYGVERANVMRRAWEQAKNSGQDIMTGLSLVTPELIRGYSMDTHRGNKTVAYNLCDNVNDLNNAIVEQNKANKLRLDRGLIIAWSNLVTEKRNEVHWLFTSQEHKHTPTTVCSIAIVSGADSWERKQYDTSASRPSAFRVLAPPVLMHDS